MVSICSECSNHRLDDRMRRSAFIREHNDPSRNFDGTNPYMSLTLADQDLLDLGSLHGATNTPSIGPSSRQSSVTGSQSNTTETLSQAYAQHTPSIRSSMPPPPPPQRGRKRTQSQTYSAMDNPEIQAIRQRNQALEVELLRLEGLAETQRLEGRIRDLQAQTSS